LYIVSTPSDFEAKIQYYRWFQESVFNGLLDPELVFYSDNTYNGYVSQWFSMGAICPPPGGHAIFLRGHG
jgi:hypothetical protein